MSLEKFFILVATLMGFIGSIYMAKGVVNLTPNVISELSTSKWNFNLKVLENIATQKADFIVGIALIFLAFFVQLLNILCIRETEKLFPSYLLGIIIALILSFSIVTVMHFYGISKKEQYIFDSKKVIAIKRINETIDDKKFDKASLDRIIDYARILFNFNRNENENSLSFLSRYSTFLKYPKLLEFKTDDIDKQEKINNGVGP